MKTKTLFYNTCNNNKFIWNSILIIKLNSLSKTFNSKIISMILCNNSNNKLKKLTFINKNILKIVNNKN